VAQLLNIKGAEEQLGLTELTVNSCFSTLFILNERFKMKVFILNERFFEKLFIQNERFPGFLLLLSDIFLIFAHES